MEFPFRIVIVSVAVQLILYIAQLKKFCVDSLEFSVYKIMSPVNVVQLLSHAWRLQSHGLQHTRLPCPSLSPSLLKFMSIKSVMPSNHLILCFPLLLLPSIFPAIGTFPMSWLFASGGQSTGVPALASVLPMNIQD